MSRDSSASSEPLGHQFERSVTEWVGGQVWYLPEVYETCDGCLRSYNRLRSVCLAVLMQTVCIGLLIQDPGVALQAIANAGIRAHRFSFISNI